MAVLAFISLQKSNAQLCRGLVLILAQHLLSLLTVGMHVCAAGSAVRQALKCLKTLRAYEPHAPNHPTAALAARCHLNGCAAEGRMGTPHNRC